MQEVGARIRARRERLGWTQMKLATLAGLTGPFISRVETGKSYYSAETLTKIAGALGVPPEEFFVRKTNVEGAPLGWRKIPVLDYVQAGDWREVNPNLDLENFETIMTDLEYPPSAFALRIRGDSMEPRFRADDVVVINPALPPQPGDFVVARCESGEATFKQYRSGGVNERGERVFELHPLNPIYAPMRSDREPLAIVGTMVEHRQYRRRG